MKRQLRLGGMGAAVLLVRMAVWFAFTDQYAPRIRRGGNVRQPGVQHGREGPMRDPRRAVPEQTQQGQTCRHR